MSKFIDLTGQRFGQLVVQSQNGRDRDGKALFLCKCDCGEECTAKGTNLRSGNTKSCGCLARANNFRHGHTTGRAHSPEYRTWTNMKTRCGNPNCDKYNIYGARGITVTPHWHTFENFLADMGRKPGPEYSIDRIDNDGIYEPSNCRWATPKQQANNQRRRRAA